MARIFLGFLVILLINKQAQSLEIFGLNFEDIQEIYNCLHELSSKARELGESYTLEVKDTNLALSEILGEMKGLSTQLMRITSYEDEKLDISIKGLLNDIEISEDLRTAKSELINNINDIQYMYMHSLEYNVTKLQNSLTKHNIVNAVLWSNVNLEHKLYNIFKLTFPDTNIYLRKDLPSLLFLVAVEKYERLCNIHMSPQQHIYAIYLLLIQTELQGFAAITHAYLIQFILDRGTNSTSMYDNEYETIRSTIFNHLVNYTKKYIEVIRIFPRDIRRCDVVNPEYGVNILELEGLFQVIIRVESDIRRRIRGRGWNYDSGDCEDIENTHRTRFSVYNCKTSNDIEGCPMKNWPGKPRFSWWKTNSETFGHSNYCPVGLHKLEGKSWLQTWYMNDVCVCSMNYTNASLDYDRYVDKFNAVDFTEPKIMKISTEPQLSDIANNMIVVGVKFILYQNAIHLQIKQAQVSKKESTKAKGVWKPVDVDNNNKTIKINYETVYDTRNIFHLDDINVDPKHVVTGVRIQKTKNGNGFELHVHSTEYDYGTRNLVRNLKWYTPGDNPIDPQDYRRERIEIVLDNPDDPTMAQDYHPDQKSNKFIQFQHSSRDKDAGSHTVPFFDAQSVEISPEYPLGGIGLFYRGRNGYGGYIAPRLFSYDISNILESSFQAWQTKNQLYERCGLKVPANITLDNSNLSCSKLKQIITKNRVSQNKNYISNNTCSGISYRQLIADHSTAIKHTKTFRKRAY